MGGVREGEEYDGIEGHTMIGEDTREGEGMG